MPEMDGLDLCRAIRKENNVPIIMLTARIEEIDKLVGLEIGADDYITKPFSPRELVARVKVVLRRISGGSTAEVIRAGEVVLDRTHYEAQIKNRMIQLTPTEFEIMATLVSQPGRIFHVINCSLPPMALRLKAMNAPLIRTSATYATNWSGGFYCYGAWRGL